MCQNDGKPAAFAWASSPTAATRQVPTVTKGDTEVYHAEAGEEVLLVASKDPHPIGACSLTCSF